MAEAREPTRLESIEEIQRALPGRRVPTVQEARPDIDTTAFRPTGRPPTALLCILDDGASDGEWVRIRNDKLVIGRSEGDIIIPHDAMMSGRHAEITRQGDEGRYRWHLNDLQSTNGTFVRIADSVLKHGQELLIGSRRYRFDDAGVGSVRLHSPAAAEVGDTKETRGWQSPATEVIPALVEIHPQGDGQRFPLARTENWIGRDPRQCSIVLADDPLVSSRHLRLYRDKKGTWHAENAKALNGTWVRINRVALGASGHFQLGEQRFVVRIS